MFRGKRKKTEDLIITKENSAALSFLSVTTMVFKARESHVCASANRSVPPLGSVY